VDFCLSTERRPGAASTRHRRFPGAKGIRLILPTMFPMNSLDLNPVDYI